MTPKLTDATVVATVGSDTVTVGDFRREMERRSGDLPGQYATLEQRRALLDTMVRFRALVARARAEGYDDDPAVVAIFERAMVTRLLEDQRRESTGTTVVTDDEIAAYYREHQRDYDRPERVRGAIVFFKTPPPMDQTAVEQLNQRVRTALEEARALDPATTHFGSVARRYSEDRSSRYTGGVIGWLIKHPNRQYKWDQAVIDALFALDEPGDIAPVVTTDDGVYLVRLVDREPAQPRPLEAVAEGIRHHLMRTRQQTIDQEFETDVFNDIDITIDEEVLEEIEAPTPAAPSAGAMVPPALPAG